MKIKDSKCVKVYGPYLNKTNGKLVWYVFDLKNKKYIVHTKFKLLELLDKLTTDVITTKNGN